MTDGYLTPDDAKPTDRRHNVYVGLWHGGVNYGAPTAEDAELFGSIREAEEALRERRNSNGKYDTRFRYVFRDGEYTRTPNAHEGNSGYLWLKWAHESWADDLEGLRILLEHGDLYPDVVLEFGPRGGIRQEGRAPEKVRATPAVVAAEESRDEVTGQVGESRCPVCGEFIDYCQGHGEIGDPEGARILAQHDDDDHSECDPRGCDEWVHPHTEEILRAYIACALWSTNDWSDESGGEPLDSWYSVSDVEGETREEMRREVVDFTRQLARDGIDWQARMGAEQFGHDFWLTRNRHGAGFWDRGLGDLGDTLTERAHVYGESDLYVGDDGNLHV